MHTEFVIDGRRVTSLETFYDEVGRVLIPGQGWGRNIDAFNDVLSGGFGTPDEGFTIKWSHSALSREKLGYPETVRQLEIKLERCHPSARDHVGRDLAEARGHTGSTVFDWIVEIIQAHGPGGAEAEDNIRLVLD